MSPIAETNSETARDTSGPPVASAQAPRRAVLLTGATGFLGRELLWQLITSLPPEFDIVCLVRERSEPHGRGSSPPPVALSQKEAAQLAEQRLQELLDAGAPLPRGDARRSRVHAQLGDITRPRLGLDDAAFAALAARTHEIYHGAATVRFDLPLREARHTNVDGTREILALAQAARAAGSLRRLHYIGTAYVAGKRRGRIGEDELDGSYGFNNTYEQTKFEAEELVRAALRGDGGIPPLPVTIYRPSIVVGDSESGYTSSFKVMYWPLKVFARGLIPVVPASRAGIVDLVPVDFVIRAILLLGGREDSRGKTYHLAAGPERSTTIGAAMDVAAEFFHVYKPLFMPLATFERWIRPLLRLALRGKRRKALDTGRIYVPYLSHGAAFDTSHTRQDLRASGLEIPDVRQYFLTLLRYCVDSDWGRKPVAKVASPGASSEAGSQSK